MKFLTPYELKELRNEVAALQISADKIDSIIELYDAIAASFVYQARGKSAAQISLSSRANRAFAGGESHDNLPKSNDFETVDLGNEGALNTKGPKRHLAP